jgi:hypothetical protein
MAAKSLTFNVKLFNGEIHPITFSSNIKKKDLTQMIKNLLPDMNEFYEICWFYEDSDPDSKLDSKEECPFPKNGETVCALARIISPTIIFTDFWNCYDQTYSRWYDNWTLVLEHNRKDMLVIDILYRKTIDGDFFFSHEYQPIRLIDESFSSNCTRIVAFPNENILTAYKSLSELLEAEYDKSKVPEGVFDFWIMEAEKKWNEMIASKTKIRPDIEEYYEWDN